MKRHGNPNYVFKGYDFTELAEYFYVDDCDDASIAIINIKLDAIRNEIIGESINIHPDIKKIREFIIKLSEEDEGSYKQPIWKALSEIIEDGTFIKFVKLLYHEAWT